MSAAATQVSSILESLNNTVKEQKKTTAVTQAVPDFSEVAEKHDYLKRSLLRESHSLVEKFEDMKREVLARRMQNEEMQKLNKIQEKTIQQLLLQLQGMNIHFC